MFVYEKRQEEIKDFLKERGMDCALITRPEHVFYLSGCQSYDGYPLAIILPADTDPVMVMPEGELDTAKEISIIKNLRPYIEYSITRMIKSEEEIIKIIMEVFKEIDFKKKMLGIESLSASRTFFQNLSEKFVFLRVSDISPLIENMRMVKSPEEIHAVRRVVELCDLAQAKVHETIKAGISEIELYSAFRSSLEEEIGAPITVKCDLVSGERTELMGGPPGNRKLKKGDLVIADIQPFLDGYWGDTTRTFVVGKPSAKQKQTYKVVLEAGRRAIAGVRQGVKVSEIDRLARDYINESGYGNYFPHHTGHGIGLEHFEPPLIIPANDIILKEGMTITIEPGIYSPGFGGIRIEENILVKKEGCEILSQYRRELV